MPPPEPPRWVWEPLGVPAMEAVSEADAYRLAASYGGVVHPPRVDDEPVPWAVWRWGDALFVPDPAGVRFVLPDAPTPRRPQLAA